MTDARTRDAHIWARDPHDWYVEPRWCSERLFDEEPFHGTIVDPAAGTGRIVDAAAARGLASYGTDIVIRAPGITGMDFKAKGWVPGLPGRAVDNIVSNPPFKDAEAFVGLALERARAKVAMLLPATWHLGSKRARWLQTTPLRRIYFLTPRPSMPPGAVIEAGIRAGGGTKDFAWYVWLRGYDGRPEVCWLHRDREAVHAAA